MGGISVMAMLSIMGALLLVVVAAAVLFVVAVVVTIVFAARTRTRREQGKKLGGLVAIPIVLYAVSVPVLALFTVGVAAPALYSSATTDYSDCSNAIVTHDPDELAAALDAPDLDLDATGVHSQRNLLRVAIVYGDVECAQLVLQDAEAKGAPLDLNAPLEDYDSEGNPDGAEYALVMATSDSFSSLDMVKLLIAYGANPNVVGEDGETPLHHASAGECVERTASGISSFDLRDTDEAIDVLLEAGAGIAAENAAGETPWDVYTATLRYYVDKARIYQEEADEFLAARAQTLDPATAKPDGGVRA